MGRTLPVAHLDSASNSMQKAGQNGFNSACDPVQFPGRKAIASSRKRLAVPGGMIQSGRWFNNA